MSTAGVPLERKSSVLVGNADSEKSQLVSLVWNLREQLSQATAQNEALQKQRFLLGNRIQLMERQFTHMQYKIQAQNSLNALLASYLLIFLVCWARQRQYNKALVHALQDHPVLPLPSIIDEEYEDDINEDMVDQEGYESDEVFEENDETGENKISATSELLSMKVNLGEQTTPHKNQIEVLAEGIIERFDGPANYENEEQGQILVDYSLLGKIQQLRMQLEDFQAILKLNESPVNSSMRSPAPSPHKKVKRPHYLKHRRTNSSTMRNSLELSPKGTVKEQEKQ